MATPLFNLQTASSYPNLYQDWDQGLNILDESGRVIIKLYFLLKKHNLLNCKSCSVVNIDGIQAPAQDQFAVVSGTFDILLPYILSDPSLGFTEVEIELIKKTALRYQVLGNTVDEVMNFKKDFLQDLQSLDNSFNISRFIRKIEKLLATSRKFNQRIGRHLGNDIVCNIIAGFVTVLYGSVIEN